MTLHAFRPLSALALLAVFTVTARTALAADEPMLQALATCRDSWLDWKDDEARMARFADDLQTRFVPGERGDAFTPKARTLVFGYEVGEIYPQSVGMGLGFSVTVRADFAQARQSMEKQLGRTMTCSTSDGVKACELKLGDKKTAVLMTGDGGNAKTSLLGCYYFYQQ